MDMSSKAKSKTKPDNARPKVRHFIDLAGIDAASLRLILTEAAALKADILTFEEHCGPIKGRTIAWVGDGNNVAQSWIMAAALFGCKLRIACPPQLSPLPEVVSWARQAGGRIEIMESPQAAVHGAD